MIFTPFTFMAATGAPAFTGLLDTYGGAKAAYSLRRLSSTYTGAAIEVRRSSDNTTQDIGFVGEDLDTSALTTFTGGGEGYVSKWYDQSGNSFDAVQATTTEQPLIVSGGTVETLGTKSAMTFDGTDDFFDLSTTFAYSNPYTLNWVFERTGGSTKNASFGIESVNKKALAWFGTSVYQNNSSLTPSGFVSYSHFFVPVGSTWELWYNDVSEGTTSANNSAYSYNAIGKYAGIGINEGKMQELILWESDETSNRAGITSNTNTYFNIF